MNPRRRYLSSVGGGALLAVGCGIPEPVDDAPEIAVCDAGYVADGGDCVPEACGVGTWGSVALDASSIYVDAADTDGGDGSEQAPLNRIQPALDLAGSVGGGIVAVAGGSYPETLELTGEHGGVQLIGRCRQMVTLDASAGDGSAPGIAISVRYGEVGVMGLNVEGSNQAGIVVGSGVVTLEDLGVVGSVRMGIEAVQDSYTPASVEVRACVLEDNALAGLVAGGGHTEVELSASVIQCSEQACGGGISAYAGAVVRAERCTLVDNVEFGLLAFDEGTSVTLVDTTIRGTGPGLVDAGEFAVQVYGGARLSAEGCVLEDNSEAALGASDLGTVVRLVDTALCGTHPDERGAFGLAVVAQQGAALEVEGCLLDGNATVGVSASGPGTELVLLDTIVRDTSSDGSGYYGYGVQVAGGAVLDARRCVVEECTAVGILVGGTGSEARVSDTLVHRTVPDVEGLGGHGIEVYGGARLVAEGCLVSQNVESGVYASGQSSRVSLIDSTVGDTRSGDVAIGGYGLRADRGATLVAQGCVVGSSEGAGALALGTGTHLELVQTAVLDTSPAPDGAFGFGVQVGGGGSAVLSGCSVTGSTAAGVLVTDANTHAVIRDTSIEATTLSASERGAVAVGLVVQDGGVVSSSGLRVGGSEGPGLLATTSGQLSCSQCMLLDNRFAGAVSVAGAELWISSSIISGTLESVNLGGGVGVYASPEQYGDPPSLQVIDSLVSGNTVAAAYLSGQGEYRLVGNRLSDSVGVPHGVTSRCGDGVYALEVGAWDGDSGLLLEGNTLADHAGAGVFLDDASAMLEANAWEGNPLDVLVQDGDCLEPSGDWSGAGSSAICPEEDRPVCELSFALSLAVPDVEDGRAVAPSLTTPFDSRRPVPDFCSSQTISTGRLSPSDF